MSNQEKINLLQDRLHKLVSNEKKNFGVQKKILREIRNLEKCVNLSEHFSTRSYRE